MSKKNAITRPPDHTLPDTPGPDADGAALATHYRRVQEFIATHAYDVFVRLCGWCLADAQEFKRMDDPHSDFMYCSERCQQAAAQMVAKRQPAGQLAGRAKEAAELARLLEVADKRSTEKKARGKQKRAGTMKKTAARRRVFDRLRRG